MNETKNTPAKVKDNPTAQVKHNQPILTGEQDNIEQGGYNKLYMSTTKDKTDPKTDFGDIPVPDDEDQQNPCRRLPMADSTQQQAGEHETYHGAVDVDTKYKFNL